MPLVLATRNKHKVREIRALLGMEILCASDFPQLKEVVENGKTLETNALKKARSVSQHTRSLALADDSGLFVDALRGAPGVRSARFAGKGCSNEKNNHKLLKCMKGVPQDKRGAEFRCVMALVWPDGREKVVIGKVRGTIGTELCGKRGFGYDPLFIFPRLRKTFAELSATQKNRLSHRGRALQKIKAMLKLFYD